MKLSLHPATASQPGKPTAPQHPRAARLQSLQQQVRQVRANPQRKRLPPQQPPISVTHAYLAALLDPVRSARHLVDQHLVAQVPALAKQAARGGLVHDQVIRAVDAAAAAWARDWPAHRIASLVSAAGHRTSAFQRAQLLKQLTAGLGFTPPLADRAAARLVPAWTAAGVKKVQGVAGMYFQQVQALALKTLKPVHHDAPPPPPPPPDGGMGPDEHFVLRGQVSAGDFVLDLGTRGDVLESRAGQIADLDTRSLFSDLNQDRQKELGLEEYTWTTMEDDRVRPEHAELDGRTFAWDAPPEIGNPGEPPNCRCQATPRLDGSTLQ